jgi:hypothetical protein
MAMAKKKVAKKATTKKETYASPAAKRKHEKGESASMKRMEKKMGKSS